MKPIWVAQWKLEVLPLGQLTSQAICVGEQDRFLRTHLGPVLASCTDATSPLYHTTSYHFMRYCAPIDIGSWSHRTGAVFVVRLFAARRYLDGIAKRFATLVDGWKVAGAVTEAADDGVSDWVQGVTTYQGGRSLAREFRDVLGAASVCCLERLAGRPAPLPDTAAWPANWAHCVNLIVSGNP